MFSEDIFGKRRIFKRLIGFDGDQLFGLGIGIAHLPLVDCLTGHADRAGKSLLGEAIGFSECHDLFVVLHLLRTFLDVFLFSLFNFFIQMLQ